MHSSPDRCVTSAPAKIPCDPFLDLLGRWVRMLGEQADDRHQEARRAEAALEAVALVKRLLHGVQRTLCHGQTFDCRYLMALGLDGEHQARPHRRAIQQNRAAPAHPMLAADVSAGEAQIVAEVVG